MRKGDGCEAKTRAVVYVVPGALGSCIPAYPPLKRWAFLCRARGTRGFMRTVPTAEAVGFLISRPRALVCVCCAATRSKTVGFLFRARGAGMCAAVKTVGFLISRARRWYVFAAVETAPLLLAPGARRCCHVACPTQASFAWVGFSSRAPLRLHRPRLNLAGAAKHGECGEQCWENQTKQDLRIARYWKPGCDKQDQEQ